MHISESSVHHHLQHQYHQQIFTWSQRRLRVIHKHTAEATANCVNRYKLRNRNKNSIRRSCILWLRPPSESEVIVIIALFLSMLMPYSTHRPKLVELKKGKKGKPMDIQIWHSSTRLHFSFMIYCMVFRKPYVVCIRKHQVIVRMRNVKWRKWNKIQTQRMLMKMHSIC